VCYTSSVPREDVLDAAKTESPALPVALRWLFPDVDLAAVHPASDAAFVLSRVLERGRLSDVRWALQHYGEEAVHAFLRDIGSTELSPRTLSFWRAYFHAENETWKSPPAWRRNKSVPWPP
jgi:hypothetical protein